MLSNPRFSEWFRTNEFMRFLSGYFSKTAEIHYQMEKLKARGLIQQRQSANYYRVTEKGDVWLNIVYAHNLYFLTPLLSEEIQRSLHGSDNGLDVFELPQNHIKQGLHAIYQELNIAA